MRISPQHRAFLAAVAEGVEPRSFSEAMKHDEWKEAMSFEIDALEVNKTWTIEPLPSGKHAIGCQWIFKIKYNADGSVERYKARLGALGNKQEEGLDYTKMFAPVSKMSTVRLFLGASVEMGWDLH